MPSTTPIREQFETYADYGEGVRNNAKRGIELNERNGNKRLEKLNALLQMLVSKVVSLQRHNRTHFRILNVKLKTPV